MFDNRSLLLSLARGSYFEDSASVLTFDNKTCGGNRDLGLLKSLGVTTGNDIDVLMCTHQ
jgi:hypothetical protein